MAFCVGAMSTIRNIWSQVTPELETIIEDVTKYTQMIKDFEKDPTVEMIVAAIPKGSAIEALLNTALDEINGVAAVVDSFAQTLTTWLATYATPVELSGGIFKLASVATKIADNANPVTTPTVTKPKTQSFYDSVVQLHIMVAKG